jgi:uncharacterized membrane protein HdeD (DUF308 family)
MRRRDQWGLLVFEGILNILVGIGAFLWPGLTVLAFVLLVAAWALVAGGLMAAAGFRLNLDRVWLLLGGLLSVAFGVLLITAPLIGAAALRWWMGAYALAFGIALVIFSFKLRARHARDPVRSEKWLPGVRIRQISFGRIRANLPAIPELDRRSPSPSFRQF